MFAAPTGEHGPGHIVLRLRIVQLRQLPCTPNSTYSAVVHAIEDPTKQYLSASPSSIDWQMWQIKRFSFDA